MAAVGAEVTGSPLFLSSGVVGFFILLLLLSIFLTALCSDCGRRSFELREPDDKNPSALIRVVKLEEAMVARENPMISEIRNDEKDFKPTAEMPTVPTVSTVSFVALRNHMGAPQNHQDIQTNGSTVMEKTGIDPGAAGESNPEEEISVSFTPWRSHLRAPQSQDVNGYTPPDSPHIYNTIGGGRGNGGGDTNATAPTTNHHPAQELEDDLSEAADDWRVDVKEVYARVSKPARLTTPTEHHTPEEAQAEAREGAESSPPLPERRTAVEG
ncbi:uncharacterized protein si:ch73-204p21.2 isoform X1 [Notolabrus celidotus]|uniref:uncharacterized protein si:ch73-204p21.2 isoform X1 n=1 Tax=Notolabrus celidotus TaxID=1203425 RepID=UPI00148FA58F|nr:uncharacterized protein si:ch73-204p21.2 isoform X1 [Notolabrus celidotus]XP_034535043.1 uncharacterized protein si:ch73-204p21.2 isoform X1 [Notolabrus celidotus]